MRELKVVVDDDVACALDRLALLQVRSTEDYVGVVLFRHVFGQMGRDPVIEPFQRPADVRLVYFMRAGVGPIKIGRSRDVQKRRIQVANGSAEPVTILVAVRESADINERALHQRFAAHRKNGEWFEPCDELLALIERLKAEAQ